MLHVQCMYILMCMFTQCSSRECSWAYIGLGILVFFSAVQVEPEVLLLELFHLKENEEEEYKVRDDVV